MLKPQVPLVACPVFSVAQHDVVPRLCPEAFEELRQEVVQVLGLPRKPTSKPPATSSSSMFDVLASAAVSAVQSHVAAAQAQPQAGQPSGIAATLRSLSLSGSSAAGAKGQASTAAWMATAGTVASAVLSQIGQRE